MSTAPAILHLSLVVGGDLTDPDGRKLGRVDDLLIRLGQDEYPPVSGAVARVAGRDVFVPAEHIRDIEHGRIIAPSSTCSRSCGARASSC